MVTVQLHVPLTSLCAPGWAVPCSTAHCFGFLCGRVVVWLRAWPRDLQGLLTWALWLLTPDQATRGRKEKGLHFCMLSTFKVPSPNPMQGRSFQPVHQFWLTSTTLVSPHSIIVWGGASPYDTYSVTFSATTACADSVQAAFQGHTCLGCALLSGEMEAGGAELLVARAALACSLSSLSGSSYGLSLPGG